MGAYLVFVQAYGLGLHGHAQAQARNHVQTFREERGHHESWHAASNQTCAMIP